MTEYYVSFPISKRIKHHLKQVQDVVMSLDGHSSLRIQNMYLRFQKRLVSIYELGKGWIEEDVHRILNAAEFAANKHREQLRKDKARTPYLVHPLSVAHHLMIKGNVRDPDIIIAALLHDTLEDTDTSYQELIELFGERVASFVQEVTDDKTLPKEERKKLQIITAPDKSAGAAQIKLADKWDNLTDLLKYPLPEWSDQRIQAYFEWAEKVIEALPWVNAALLQTVKKVIEKKLKTE